MSKKNAAQYGIALLVLGLLASQTETLGRSKHPESLAAPSTQVRSSLHPTNSADTGDLRRRRYQNAIEGKGAFLPEAHTDFVFALLYEELGIAASPQLLLEYLLNLASINAVHHSVIGLLRLYIQSR